MRFIHIYHELIMYPKLCEPKKVVYGGGKTSSLFCHRLKLFLILIPIISPNISIRTICRNQITILIHSTILFTGFCILRISSVPPSHVFQIIPDRSRRAPLLMFNFETVKSILNFFLFALDGLAARAFDPDSMAAEASLRTLLVECV